MCQPAHIASLCNISIFILLLKGVQPTLTTWAQCNVRHSWIRCNVLLTNVVVSLLVSSFHIGVNDWARLHLVRKVSQTFPDFLSYTEILSEVQWKWSFEFLGRRKCNPGFAKCFVRQLSEWNPVEECINLPESNQICNETKHLLSGFAGKAT